MLILGRSWPLSTHAIATCQAAGLTECNQLEAISLGFEPALKPLWRVVPSSHRSVPQATAFAMRCDLFRALSLCRRFSIWRSTVRGAMPMCCAICLDESPPATSSSIWRSLCVRPGSSWSSFNSNMYAPVILTLDNYQPATRRDKVPEVVNYALK